MDLRDILAALSRQKWLAFAVLVVEVGAVLGFLAVAPRQYTATASVTATPVLGGGAEGSGIVHQLLATIGEVVHSSDVLAGARSRLTPQPSLSAMRESVSGEAVTGTLIIRIHAVDTSPRRAADIANAVAAELPSHDPSGGQIDYRTIETARPPDTASSPNTRLVLPLGVVLGVVLGAAAALLRDNAVRRVGTADEVQDAVGAPVLARVPRPRDVARAGALDPESGEAAAFRALRIALEFAAARDPLPALVVTSVVPDETDGWLATNLAIALAQVQHNVLLVDGNLAAPRAGEGPGLAEVLNGADLEPLLQAGPVPGLRVLRAGDATGDVAELVETRFGEALLRWTAMFDVVVVDAPAVTVSDDARVMAVAGAVVLTIPVGRVSPRTLRDAAASLRVVSSRIAGTVLVGGAPTGAAAPSRSRRGPRPSR